MCVPLLSESSGTAAGRRLQRLGSVRAVSRRRRRRRRRRSSLRRSGAAPRVARSKRGQGAHRRRAAAAVTTGLGWTRRTVAVGRGAVIRPLGRAGPVGNRWAWPPACHFPRRRRSLLVDRRRAFFVGRRTPIRRPATMIAWQLAVLTIRRPAALRSRIRHGRNGRPAPTPHLPEFGPPPQPRNSRPSVRGLSQSAQKAAAPESSERKARGRQKGVQCAAPARGRETRHRPPRLRGGAGRSWRSATASRPDATGRRGSCPPRVVRAERLPTLARENGEGRGRPPARSGEEAEGVAVGLCQADEALPHLAGHAGVIAELGDNLRRRGAVIVSTIAAHLK